MTLKPVQASSVSVSIQIQAGPSQLMPAQILTQVNFLLKYFLLNVFDILALAFFLNQFDTVLRQLVLCQTTVGDVVLMDKKSEKLN